MKINWNDYREDIEKMRSEGFGSPKCAKALIEKYPNVFDPDKVEYYGRRIRKMSIGAGDNQDNEIRVRMDDARLPQEQTWEYAWLTPRGVSAFVKKGKISLEAIREGYIEAVKEAIKNMDWPNYPAPENTGNLLVPCIMDLHIGKLAWGEETGEDYDYKIAVVRFRNALSDLIAKSNGYAPERIVFPVGNDIYNSDKAKPFPQTTNGTPQMDDLRWQKLFRVGVQLITEAVIQLSKIAPVDVIMVYSNHDHERVFYLGETLSAVFDSHPSVVINNSPTMRKYYQWGECLLGFAHGHNEKPTDLPLIMAQEAKTMWSSTFYREWLLGHLHHKQKFLTQESKDYRSVRVTYITSPSAADAWHSERAFTGAIKGAEAFIYSKTEGLIGTVIHNIK